jgi:cytochrome c oxidase subunit II
MFTNLPLFPERASVQAGQVDAIYFFMVAVTAFFAFLIAGLIVFFAFRYRRRHRDEIGVPIHGSLALELTWTIIPFFIVMGMFAWGAKVFFDLYRVPAGAMEIFVVGKQWMWKIQHMGGQSEINELHVPLGQPVKITFTSEDVLHSLYIPAFRVKADAIPGRYSTIWFTATRVGEYHLFCAEYCGTQHSGMIGRVVVLEPADYQAWLSGGSPGDPMAVQGERLFADLGCQTCHTDDGTGRGPALDGIFNAPRLLATGRTVRADEAYLRQAILNPQATVLAGYQPLMPTFQGLVTEDGVMALIEYIKSLSAPRTEASAASRDAGAEERH